MPWPKGKPRKGHVNKDGTPHKPKGFTIRKSLDTGTERAYRKVRTRSQIVSSTEKVETASSIHGATNRPIIEPCPNCGYAYGDGGYCPECGWSAPIKPGRVY